MPFLRYMGNSVFFTEGSSEEHRLSIGRKNLVQEIKLGGLSIFSLHLATFGGWIRKKQLEQVKKIAESREKYLLAGDLNMHKGRKEIKYLEQKLGEKVHSPGKTFPAKNPDQKLDLVASSENVEIKNLKELGNRFSDHRPMKFEIRNTL
jgi:endonuclease/exonuclease/phosphatase family metal-dependent hydrolase